MDRVLLIDGLFLIHRSNVKFGVQDNSKPSYVIVYNFFRSLKALVSTFKPTRVFFCLEGRNNFRYNILPSYKNNRIVKQASESKSESFSRQRDLIIDLIKNLPITLAESDRFEADDVIGTLCEDLKEEDITIISSDSDYIQILQKGYANVRLYNPIKKEFIRPPDFHYLGWKILRGDKATDNIPGIVSDSKAEGLVRDPELLERFLLDEENRSAFNLNKELIELKMIPCDDLVLTQGSINLALLYEEFCKMQFASFLKEQYWKSFTEAFTEICETELTLS